jgi:DNA sulfur modification protein DndB
MTIIKNVVKRVVAGRTYYFGSMPSSVINKVTFVPVLENSPKTSLVENIEDGYQRPGSMPRMNKFKSFLQKYPQSLVPPVILSARGRWQYKASNFSEVIGDLEVAGPAAIIDGQHRLGGFVALYEATGTGRDVDFIVLESLTRDEEIAEFDIINNTQVGVPKSLSVFITAGNQLLEGLGSRINSDFVRIAWDLSIDASSPFYGRISRTRLGSEHLFALHSVASQLEKMFSHGALSELDYEKKRDITIKYWNIIQDSHPIEFEDLERMGEGGRKKFEHKLLELTGFIAWSQIGYQILGGAFNPKVEEMNWDDVQEQVEYLSTKVDWRKDGQYKNATGVVGGPQIRLDMERLLQMRGA